MDISGLIISSVSICFEVSSRLYSYGKNVKSARGEIQALSSELFGIVGALEQLKWQYASIDDGMLEPEAHSYDDHHIDTSDTKKRPLKESVSLKKAEGEDEDDEPPAYGDLGPMQSAPRQKHLIIVLRQTVDFLEDLQKKLEVPKSRLGRTTQVMKWPLQQGQMQTHLKRLERVKTYFILALVTDEADQSRKVADEIMSLRNLIQATAGRQAEQDNQVVITELAEWLCSVRPSATKQTIEKLRTPGTGAWFLQSPEYQDFFTSQKTCCLWMNGITGAGKSTLMSSVVDEITQSTQGSGRVAYFYCAFTNDESLQTQSVLGSILTQLWKEGDPILEEFRNTYHSGLGATHLKLLARPPRAKLVESIRAQIEKLDGAYILIDGMNECHEVDELLEDLTKILTTTSKTRLFLSSINEKGMTRCLKDMPRLSTITLRPSTIRKDVSLLVAEALDTKPRLRCLSDKLKGDIIARLSNGAEGMFRWVQCQLDLLSSLRTPGAVEKALLTLPPSLDRTYEGILARIGPGEDRALSRQILEILAFSYRPLRLVELCEMLQVTPGLLRLDDSKRLSHPRDILEICGAFLKFSEKTSFVTLAHHSVKTYLMSKPCGDLSDFLLDEVQAHTRLALYCITYLSFDEFSRGSNTISSPPNYPFHQKQSVKSSHVLLNYASYGWGTHLKEVPAPYQDPTLQSSLLDFLKSEEAERDNFEVWVSTVTGGSAHAKKTSPLYYAASYGLLNIVQLLLDDAGDEAPALMARHGGRGGATPLNIAAFRGHLPVVKELMSRGADPHVADAGGGYDAIQWAKYRRHACVVEYFQSLGFSPGSR